MHTRKAIALPQSCVDRGALSRPPRVASAADVNVLNEALDRVAAMWIALTLGGTEREQLVADVQAVMRLVRSALHHHVQGQTAHGEAATFSSPALNHVARR